MAAILFDMDGLLLDTERVALSAYRDACAALGLTAPEDLFLQMVGKSGDKSRALLAQHFGPTLDVAALERLWENSFEDRLSNHVPLRPGVATAIPQLRKRGVTMVVVTSTNTPAARRELKTAGLLDYFNDVVGGDVVKNRKPDPEPYLTGAACAGCAPADCYAFEDSDTGVASAVAAGCITSQIPDLRPPGTPVPELGQTVYASLTDALTATGWL